MGISLMAGRGRHRTHLVDRLRHGTGSIAATCWQRGFSIGGRSSKAVEPAVTSGQNPAGWKTPSPDAKWKASAAGRR